LLISNFGKAQYSIDSFSLKDTSSAWLDRRIDLSNTEIYTASEPKVENYSWNSTPFLKIEDGREGTLMYRGEKFKGVRMLYDLYGQQLLAELLINNEYYKIVLLNQKQIEWFKVGSYHFKRYSEDTENRPPGFYAVVFEGLHIDIIIKKEKRKRIERGDFVFIEDDKVLIKLGDQYNQINNRRSLYNLMKPYKDKIRTYLKNRNIKRFDKASLEELYNLGSFCDQLIINK
jgi:hypothetical protein